MKWLKWLLDEYCRVAGQKVNFTKLEILVCPNMRTDSKELILVVLGIRVVDKQGIYLGVELDFTK